MDLSSYLALVAIAFMGAVSPGPSLALIIRNTVQGGKAYGVATALGHGMGVGVYALLTAVGLSLLLSSSPMLFDLIRYTGAAFLAYLGVKSLMAKPADPNAPLLLHQSKGHKGAAEGFLIAFLNPHLALFFIALFSQFVHSDTGWSQALLMMLTVGTIDALWYCLVAVLLSTGPVLAWLRLKGHWIDRISGVVLLALAIKAIL
ncbi:LysE family translocator [Rheinheimera sp.]|uniref:LysE family translocator n=1 Tax=Rheinheimera sp. TaxID=1869214 RepID=UPI00307F39EE